MMLRWRRAKKCPVLFWFLLAWWDKKGTQVTKLLLSLLLIGGQYVIHLHTHRPHLHRSHDRARLKIQSGVLEIVPKAVRTKNDRQIFVQKACTHVQKPLKTS